MSLKASDVQMYAFRRCANLQTPERSPPVQCDPRSTASMHAGQSAGLAEKLRGNAVGIISEILKGILKGVMKKYK